MSENQKPESHQNVALWMILVVLCVIAAAVLLRKPLGAGAIGETLRTTTVTTTPSFSPAWSDPYWDPLPQKPAWRMPDYPVKFEPEPKGPRDRNHR